MLLLHPLTLGAQGRFKIEVKVDALKNGDKIYLVYQVGDQHKTDSALVQNGQFAFEGKLAYPVSSSLFLHKNPYVNKPAPGERMDYFRFYLEPARFSLAAPDSLKHLKVKGSRINDLNRELMNMLEPIDNKFTALQKEFEALPQERQKDKQVFDGLVAREREILTESFWIHLAFIKKHPDAYLSLISLSHIAAEPELNSEAKKAYDQLSPGLKRTPLAQSIFIQLAAPEAIQIGKMAPDFEQTAPDGTKVRLSDFRSRYVLIDFWASWCGPCREENPNLVAAYNRYKDKGFNVLGVSLDGPSQRKAWLKAIEKDRLTWTHGSDLKGWENSAAQMYGIRMIPDNFLIDPLGKIIARGLRGEALQEKLAEIFDGK